MRGAPFGEAFMFFFRLSEMGLEAKFAAIWSLISSKFTKSPGATFQL